MVLLIAGFIQLLYTETNILALKPASVVSASLRIGINERGRMDGETFGNEVNVVSFPTKVSWACRLLDIPYWLRVFIEQMRTAFELNAFFISFCAQSLLQFIVTALFHWQT